MPNRFPLSTAPVVTPAGISTPPAGAFSSLSDALAADGFDALGRWIAAFTAGVGPTIPKPIPCANTQPSADGAARSLVGIASQPGSMAREGRPISSLADGGEVFDLRSIPAELRDDTRDYLCRHDLTWKEPCADCDADMVRTICLGCDGRGGYEDCICWGHGWVMCCEGCGALDSDPRVLAAERRALGIDGEGADRG